MGWNDQGGDGGRDPWGGRGNQGPPDLDEVVRKLQEKFGGMFGGGGTGLGRPGSGFQFSMGFGLILAIVAAVWGLSGLYIVDEAKQGVVLRFGKYVETTGPGLRWHMPYPIETVKVINTSEIRTVEIGYRSSAAGTSSSVPHEALMLTQDENIIEIAFAVQYRIKDARDYWFNVAGPETTLHEATESAVREIVGKSTMDFVLTEGRGEIAQKSEQLIQDILDRYKAGLLVTSVNTQKAQPPEEVKGAFDDAIKAREDEVRKKNEAEAYSNDILPKARGDGVRLREEARGYKARVVALAEGETERFLSVLKEYEKAPRITRERLYIEAMESVLSNSSKIVVDVKGGNSLLYLPLDQLMRQHQSASGGETTDETEAANEEQAREALRRIRESMSENQRRDARARGGR